MKSYELKISFDPSLLHANMVTEGAIFTGYTTFFNAGTINNTAGTIVDVYGLILGNGNVSTPGTLVCLSFTAQPTSGSSPISLFDVGITNETAYVPVTISNGTVTLREFTVSVSIDGSGGVTKNPNQATYPYGTMVQLTATADTGWVFDSWGGDLSGSTNPASITMTSNKSVTALFTQNYYTLTITVSGTGSVTKNPDQPTYPYGAVVTLTAEPGAGWAFHSWNGDLTGNQNPTTITINGNKTVTAAFVDALPPQVSSLASATSDPLDTDPVFGWVNVSCTVIDNVEVSQVVLLICNPDDSWNNVSMTLGISAEYYYLTSTGFSAFGNYTYLIYATDTSNNSYTSESVGFSMPPNWDINNDGRCNILDLVLVSNQYGTTGNEGWIREDADNSGEIQVLDLVAVSNHFGEIWWG